MSIYSVHMQTIKRSEGRRSTACAAYRAGARIADGRTGKVFDYRRRKGVLHSELVGWSGDRAELWNAAEIAEKRKDSQVARECVIALPHELPLEANIEAMRQLAAEIRERWSVAVDLNIHQHGRQDTRNIHCHCMTTVRAVKDNQFGKKTRQLDVSTTAKIEIEWLREIWERIANRMLAEAGLDMRIDRRSLMDRGEAREAKQTLGHAASALERKGQPTAQGAVNRQIDTQEEQRNDLERRIEQLEEEKAEAMIDMRRLEYQEAELARLSSITVVAPARSDEAILRARAELIECRKVLASTYRLVPVTVDEYIEDRRYHLASLTAYEQSARRHQALADETENERPVLTRLVNWLGWRSLLPDYAAHREKAAKRARQVQHIRSAREQYEERYAARMRGENEQREAKYLKLLEAQNRAYQRIPELTDLASRPITAELAQLEHERKVRLLAPAQRPTPSGPH